MNRLNRVARKYGETLVMTPKGVFPERFYKKEEARTMNLAINGGPRVRTKNFPEQNTIGEDEKRAVMRVMEKGRLTGYSANWGRLKGGEEVQKLEEEWCAAFGASHAIPVNSCTSGLLVALGAVGVGPGDEVIVTPYSMTCSATAPMFWGATPVFADINPFTFSLDPFDVEKRITPRTKAILVVSLFGLPYSAAIDRVAKRHGLRVIEDAAQSVGAMRNGMYSGTLADIGVHSFNLGKHLTCGEGGMICTGDPDLALRCRLLVNHAESVVNDMRYNADAFDNGIQVSQGQREDLSGMYGFNFRMTEVSAAIVRAQLARRHELIDVKVKNAEYLQRGIGDIPGLLTPIKMTACSQEMLPVGYTHTYYVLPLLFDKASWDGASRDRVVRAVREELASCTGREYEGVPIRAGYIKPIWRMPVFGYTYQKQCLGDEEDFTSDTFCSKDGILWERESLKTPVCDDVNENDLIIIHRLYGPKADKESLDDVVRAFEKVYLNRGEL